MGFEKNATDVKVTWKTHYSANTTDDSKSCLSVSGTVLADAVCLLCEPRIWNSPSIAFQRSSRIVIIQFELTCRLRRMVAFSTFLEILLMACVSLKETSVHGKDSCVGAAVIRFSEVKMPLSLPFWNEWTFQSFVSSIKAGQKSIPSVEASVLDA